MPCQALLWQNLAFSSPFLSFNYLSSIILFRRHCVVSFSVIISSCEDHDLFMLIPLTGVSCPLFKYPLILSRSCSIPSIYRRSAARICSPLFLFPNGVLSTSFISVASFLSICLTFQGSLVWLVCQRSNLVLPLPLPPPFPRCHPRSWDEILS